MIWSEKVIKVNQAVKKLQESNSTTHFQELQVICKLFFLLQNIYQLKARSDDFAKQTR